MEKIKTIFEAEIDICKCKIFGVSDDSMLEANPKIHLRSEYKEGRKKAILLIEIWNGQIAILNKILLDLNLGVDKVGTE